MADITKEEVYEILNFLNKNKMNISKERVRNLLGKRGSYTTISKHIASWQLPKRNKIAMKELNVDEKIDYLLMKMAIYRQIQDEIQKNVDELQLAYLDAKKDMKFKQSVLRGEDRFYEEPKEGFGHMQKGKRNVNAK
jgi:hypothetical protein